MNGFKEYSSYDATALAQLIKDKQVSRQEVLQAAFDMADATHPQLNAVVHRFDEEAKQYTEQACGVFAGVPFLIKDLGAEYKGQPLSFGSRALKVTPKKDNEYVKRIKAAGLVSFGKTNTPEFGLTITTEPKAHGATHNPCKPGFSSGGSSGGSAAVVKAGVVPMASAGDGGGSIRFPASWCGVFGLKPSRGRVPVGPGVGEQWSGAVADHVVTRTVRDSASMLDQLSGYMTGAPYKLSEPEGGFLSASLQAHKPLKIAMSKHTFVDSTLDPEVLAALYKTATLLESMGHTVEEVEPKINPERFWRDFYVVISANLAHVCAHCETLFGESANLNLIEPATKSTLRFGMAHSAMDLLEAKRGWQLASEAVGEVLDTYDLMLCPTTPTPAVQHGVLLPTKAEEALLKLNELNPSKTATRLMFHSPLARSLILKIMSKMTYTILGNMSGLPAMSTPLAESSIKLPIGMQFYGRMGDEATLLRLATQLEQEGKFLI